MIQHRQATCLHLCFACLIVFSPQNEQECFVCICIGVLVWKFGQRDGLGWVILI